MSFLDMSSQSSLSFTSSSTLLPSFLLLVFFSSEEDNKDDEEDDKDKKDLDHQPAVGGHGLEVFEDLCVGSIHI